MIIQQVIKGINGIGDPTVQQIFKAGITCNWWRNSPNGILPRHRVPEKLTDRNLDWHQDSYDQVDPLEGSQTFSINTPYISTTAGTVERERDVAKRTNTLTPAWKIALYFATDAWRKDGWLFYCHLFLIGKRTPAMEGFSEEVRELHRMLETIPLLPDSKNLLYNAAIERFGDPH